MSIENSDQDWPKPHCCQHLYLQIENDPNDLVTQLNSQIENHNKNRAESDAILRALKDKLREEKQARKEERTRWVGL